MSETVTPEKFSVEGEQGSEADERSREGPGRAGDRGRGEAGAAAVQRPSNGVRGRPDHVIEDEPIQGGRRALVSLCYRRVGPVEQTEDVLHEPREGAQLSLSLLLECPE